MNHFFPEDDSFLPGKWIVLPGKMNHFCPEDDSFRPGKWIIFRGKSNCTSREIYDYSLENESHFPEKWIVLPGKRIRVIPLWIVWYGYMDRRCRKMNRTSWNNYSLYHRKMDRTSWKNESSFHTKWIVLPGKTIIWFQEIIHSSRKWIIIPRDCESFSPIHLF